MCLPCSGVHSMDSQRVLTVMRNGAFAKVGCGLSYLMGLASFVFIAVNLTFWIVPVILLAVVKLLAPSAWIRQRAYRMMIWIYSAAVKTNDILLFGIVRNRLTLLQPLTLDRGRNYLVLSNHRSWADILLLQSLLNKKTPPIQFIVKRELLFMPIIGLICWAYEYPFVRRGSLKSRKDGRVQGRSDMQNIRAKIDKTSTSGLSIINFVEGTRFNILKSEKYASSFKHLLNPRAGGLFHILKNYAGKLDTVLDFTIVYGCRTPVFWKFLGGRCRHITVDLQRIHIKDLLETLGTAAGGELTFGRVSEWLQELWHDKDLKIEAMINEQRA